jgi:phage shock protein PspC (stress-responsive transcriptional regulator)
MYIGDTLDTPPLWIRILMVLACTFGAVLMVLYTLRHGQVPFMIITLGGLGVAAYLQFTVPRVSHTAFTTMFYWALLAALVTFMPVGS